MAYQDLLKDTSQYVETGDYFLLTITDLDINTSYPIQFRWKKKDGTNGVWSAVKIITTPGESTPATPSTLTVTGGAGILTVSWDGKDSLGNLITNIDRLDIYIDGSPFDSTKPATSFFTAGTQTISAPAGTYIVAAYAVSKANTKSAINSAVTRTVTSNTPSAESSVTPSTPTVSSVLGAIQLSWNGKTSTGGNQPYGFDAAKVYVGTTSNFTPSSLNQVDTLNFANGQNTLNIGVGTVIDGVALNYGIDYYVKIATTNGTDTSTAVSASGNPVRIGQVKSGDIVTVTADKIDTGTLSSSSTITVGSPSGKHVTLAGTGDPFTIYDTDGSTKLLSYSTTSGKLSIIGDGSFTGNLAIGSSNSIFKAEPAIGIWLGNATYSSAPFSVSANGVIKANSGTIGGWTLASSYLENSAQTFQINSSSSTVFIGPYSSGDHIRISASGGIQHTNSSGVPTGKFTLSPNGNLTLSGTFTIDASSTIDGTPASTVKSNATAGSTAIQPGNGVSLNGNKYITTISAASGLTITTGGSGARVELTSSGLKAYDNSNPSPTVSINSDGSASFTGVVNASSGYIGGWYFGSTYLSNIQNSEVAYYINASNGNMAMNEIFIRQSAGSDGVNLLNGSDLRMNGGTIYTGTNGTIVIGTSSVINGPGSINLTGSLTIGNLTTTVINSSGGVTFPNGNIIGSSGSITFAGVTSASPSGYYNLMGTAGGVLRFSTTANSSTIKAKEEIESISKLGYINIIDKLNPVTFKFKQNYTRENVRKTHVGLIAEEVAKIPELETIVMYNEENEIASLEYDKLSVLLILTLKEMKDKIFDMQKRLDALEG
jgi:Chaperone of endosialidase